MTDADSRTIHQRMLAILDELPAIGKRQRNTQQGFNFRGHDDVMNALTPLLAKHGVYFVPEVLERIPAVRQTRSGGAMYEVNLHVRYTFYAPDGSSVTGSTWGEGTDSGDKSTNKAMTMALKNVLAQAFAINTEEASAYDADKHSPEETVIAQPAAAPAEPPKPARKQPVTPKQTARYAELLRALQDAAPRSNPDWHAIVETKVYEQTQGGTLADLSKTGYDNVLEMMDGWLRRLQDQAKEDPVAATLGQTDDGKVSEATDGASVSAESAQSIPGT